MAIAGLGTDIVEITRLEKIIQRTPGFAERVLTENEIKTYESHKFQARFLAKRFAVKEAAVKALGTGISNGVSFYDVEVVNLASGQPVLNLSGRFAELCKQRDITQSFVSISDEKLYAVATVILETS